MTTTVSSSPRLPSPPPFTEVQIPPASLPPSASKSVLSTDTRRIRPGTSAADILPGPPLTEFTELDSAFQLQEHLAALIASYTHSSTHTTPLSREACIALSESPPGIEEGLWCYELTRRLTRDLNTLIVALLTDGCTAQTCPEMRASEWQYLCAVHESPQSCCAIDYSTHTLDQAATMLTSTKFFPSRLSLGQGSTKHLASIFRRLYRIFAHAWFQHRHCFWEVEGERGLYLLFKTVSDRYSLIPKDNLTLPPEAEGLKCEEEEGGEEEEEEEEEEFEWDRGHGEEEEDEEQYSDESESDEEILKEEPLPETESPEEPPIEEDKLQPTPLDELPNLKIPESKDSTAGEYGQTKEDEHEATPIEDIASSPVEESTSPAKGTPASDEKDEIPKEII